MYYNKIQVYVLFILGVLDLVVSANPSKKKFEHLIHHMLLDVRMMCFN